MKNDNFNEMNGGGLGDELEARIVAWVLGEASAFEAAELERLCAERPEAAVFKRRLQAVHGLVGEAAKPVQEPLRLSAERRAKVLAVIGGAAVAEEEKPKQRRAKRPFWREWALPMAACFAVMTLLAAVLIPTMGNVGVLAKKPKRPDPAAVVFELAPQEQLNEMMPAFQAVEMRGGGVATISDEGGEGVAYALEKDLPQLGAGMVDRSLTVSGSTGLLEQLGARDQALVVSGNGFSAGLGKDDRLAAVLPEVRYRRQLHSTADPFAAPSADAYAGNVEAGAANGLLDKAHEQLKLGDTRGARESLELYGQFSSSLANNGSTWADADRRRGSDGDVAKTKQAAELATKGRSQYLAGDLDGAQETFRTLEAESPESPEAKSFLGRIREERTRVAEMNRVKMRGQLLEEVSHAWQRPSEQEKPMQPWDSPDQPRRKRSSITITAGTPQTFETIAFTKADQMELNGRIADRKAALGNASDSEVHQAIAEVVKQFTDEIKAIEEKAEQRTKQPVFDEDVRTEISTSAESVSTFSLHVSDAAFRLAKAALERGQLPDAATVRPEEFYNAFDYGDPAPVAGEAVSCRVEQAGHPFLQQRNLVRIAMRVPAAGRGAGTALRLTVLLDTSGSMEREDRAATVRAALAGLTGLLGPEDRVTLVGFARTPRLLAENVSGDQVARLVEIAANTPAEGGTNLEEALALAGELARRHKVAGAQNRIVLLTDGAANLGDANPEALGKRVEALRQNGIAFDACGVVADGLEDSVLEALTRKGDGRYVVIGAPEEADAAFARRLAGAFRPAAKDVKVQVRFNPARVGKYRLIGFEKHRLRTEDFRNDAVDAAELAAEEAAVALYQVEVLPDGEGELGEVSVRFLDTRSGERVERSWIVGYVAQPAAFGRATASMQLAGCAAFFAEKLRGGALAGQVRLEELAPVVEGLAGAYPEAERVREFVTMVRQARRVVGE